MEVHSQYYVLHLEVVIEKLNNYYSRPSFVTLKQETTINERSFWKIFVIRLHKSELLTESVEIMFLLEHLFVLTQIDLSNLNHISYFQSCQNVLCRFFQFFNTIQY